jgi:hypothetical protein
MLTSEDHRQLARRCISLAKECTKASVAEHLLMLAADYLDQAELSLIASALSNVQDGSSVTLRSIGSGRLKGRHWDDADKPRGHLAVVVDPQP